MLGLDVLPQWQSRPVKAITRRDVHGLPSRPAPRPHRGSWRTRHGQPCLGAGVSYLPYGIDKDWLDHNPAARISKQKETPRERVLTDEELKGFLTVLQFVKTGRRVTDDHPAPPLSSMLARGLELMLRTAQRGGEVFTMRWEDVDEASGWWTIPSTGAKNSQAHRVPLTKAALTLIAEARADGSGPDGWVFAGPEGGSLHSRAVKVVPILRNTGVIMGDYWRHDLRRTVGTTMTKLGIPRAMLSHVLNHKTDRGPRATAVYDKYDYDREKRKAMEVWGRHLDALIHGITSARVVPFRQ